LVTVAEADNVAVIKMDDGKANAVSHKLLDELNAALENAADADAIVLLGRDGKFSAGFDLSVMQGGSGGIMELVTRGAELAVDLFMWKRPVVFGVTGHSLAMGAVLMCCADHRVGADGNFKIGFNEVAIGLPMPEFAVEIARERLTTPAFHQSISLAKIYDPAGALAAGFLDEVVDPAEVETRAVEDATQLAGYLNLNAFEITRKSMRGEAAERLKKIVGIS
jgi:enoyl-CoA hydratase